MKVIVIKQPWAWLIVNRYKDIENRSWRTKYRGTLLIQASKNLPPRHEFAESVAFARKCGVSNLPDEFETGGIVGMAQLTDCVPEHKSQWFEGPLGWVLKEQGLLPFMQLKGRLGLFDPPAEIRSRVVAYLDGQRG